MLLLLIIGIPLIVMVLYKQGWQDHFEYLLNFFKDERYLKDEQGRPILLIYKPQLITTLDEMLSCWRDLAQKAGLPGICFVCQYPQYGSEIEDKFDHYVEFEPAATTGIPGSNFLKAWEISPKYAVEVGLTKILQVTRIRSYKKYSYKDTVAASIKRPIRNNLKKDIILGYHAHNNLQQAYGNAKYMIEQKLTHDIMLDASVYGMGRGAGNLNMELFASYLNKNYDKNYDIDMFLDIMDEYLKPIFAEHYWGYSLPFYLSAQYNCHPNYAGYFADKNTLSNKSMRQLLASLPAEMKNHYSAEQAEECYQAFQRNYVDDRDVLEQLKKTLLGRPVLILAPGRTLKDKTEDIALYIKDNQPIVVAINTAPGQFKCDYLFCANEKRVKNLNIPNGCSLILSSNIRDDIEALRINYTDYLGTEDLVADNPALMLIRLFIKIGLKDVTVAGLDGYSATSEDNYFDSKLALGTGIGVKIQKNELIKKELDKLSDIINIQFLTHSRYEN